MADGGKSQDTACGGVPAVFRRVKEDAVRAASEVLGSHMCVFSASTGPLGTKPRYLPPLRTRLAARRSSCCFLTQSR